MVRKKKFPAIVPKDSKYKDFGRSTKILPQPKDIPELNFPRDTLPVEVTIIESMNNKKNVKYITDSMKGNTSESEISSLKMPDTRNVSVEGDKKDKARITDKNKLEQDLAYPATGRGSGDP